MQKYTGGYILPKNRTQNYTGSITSRVGIFLPVTPDPGFPVGGAWTHFGGFFCLRRGYFSVKMYAKMKEFGPVGGRAPARPPRSAHENYPDPRTRT